MFDNWLRLWKDLVLERSLPKRLTNPHPLVYTSIAFLTGLSVVVLVLVGNYHAALICWILSRFFDGLDGYVARDTGRTTDIGAFLDIVGDFTIYSIIVVVLTWVGRTSEAVVLLGLLILASFYVNAISWSFLSTLLTQRSLGDTTMPRGLVEGFETVIFYSLFLLFPQLLVELFLIFFGLMAVTIVIRVGSAVKRLG